MLYVRFTIAPRQLLPLSLQVCIIPNITTEDYTYCYGGKLSADPAKSFRPLINCALHIISCFDSLIVQIRTQSRTSWLL